VAGECRCQGTPHGGGNLWENGYCDSFHGKLRGELLGGEISCSLKEAKVFIEQWRQPYNTVGPIFRIAANALVLTTNC